MKPEDEFPDELVCVRCREPKEHRDLDRLLWCETCRAEARRRASQWGWLGGTVIAAALALWIWLVIQPSDLVLGGWIATVLAALYLCGRICREIVYGLIRARNRRAPGSVR
jgi:hypothetical protein